MPITALLFDLDDTLYAERDYAFSGFAAVAVAFADRLGEPAQTAFDMRRLFDSEQRRRVFNEVLTMRGLSDEPKLVKAMIDIYRTHRPTIKLLPDAEAALCRFHGRYRLGLITDGPAVMQSAKVEALGLRSRMDAVILTDELGPGLGKPHRRSFEMISTQLGASGEECAYVADNVSKDFVAPNALGWRSIRIVRPDGVYRDVPAAAGGSPDHEIESLDELDVLLA